MKISIITSCFNREDTIGSAIESVLGQTYKDLEYVVVDGGSTDRSREIISGYGEGISKIVFKDDNGLYEGINNGIRATTGDVIGLCHSDDRLFSPDTVAAVAKAFERHPEADIIYADGIYIDSTKEKAKRVWKSAPLKRWKLRLGWLPLHTTCYVRRRVFERYGLYDERYKIAADTKFLLTVLSQKEVQAIYLPQVVVTMNMGGASTDKERLGDMWQEDIRVFRELGIRWPRLMKCMKMMWKPAQFVRAWLQTLVSK